MPTFSALPTRRANYSNITQHNYAANHGNTGYVPGDGVTAYDKPVDYSGIKYGGAPFLSTGIVDEGTATTKYPAKQVKAKEIPDGLSKTIMFAEMVPGVTIGGDLRAMAWWGPGSMVMTYLGPNSLQPDVSQSSSYCTNDDKDLPCSPNSMSSTLPMTFASRSRHPSGVHVSLCDGSVHFASDEVSMNVWQAMGTTRGGEVASSEELK
ncbi:MAG: DUF1559 domain-containing protein [Pirellulales bacterium]